MFAVLGTKVIAKLTLYNFSAFINNHTSASKNKKKDNKHSYKINFYTVIKICHNSLKIPKSQPVPNVIAWIERNLRVDKTGAQHFMRNLRGIGACSFLYRFA